MLNEKRIRQMTELARFERREKNGALRIGKYFRSDYIGIALLKNFFIATLGYLLIAGAIAFYHMEWLQEKFDSINLLFLGGCVIASYLVFVLFYSAVVYILASVRYAKMKRRLKRYDQLLRELERQYEAEDRRRDRNRHGRNAR